MQLALPATASVVFDGQSLNVLPGGVNSYPYKVMALVNDISGPHVIFSVPGVGGQSWTNLAQSQSRTIPHAFDAATHNVWVGVGGTGDIRIDNNTGAELYADTAGYAQDMTAAGYTYIIGTTTTPAESMTAPQLANLADGNALIIADALGAFDAVVDLGGTPGLDDPLSIYYADGVHWSNEGSTLAAETMLPAILTALELA